MSLGKFHRSKFPLSAFACLSLRTTERVREKGICDRFSLFLAEFSRNALFFTRSPWVCRFSFAMFFSLSLFSHAHTHTHIPVFLSYCTLLHQSDIVSSMKQKMKKVFFFRLLGFWICPSSHRLTPVSSWTSVGFIPTVVARFSCKRLSCRAFLASPEPPRTNFPDATRELPGLMRSCSDSISSTRSHLGVNHVTSLASRKEHGPGRPSIRRAGAHRRFNPSPQLYEPAQS